MSYVVKPKGINIKDNERTVADGFLQESINMQWRDGAYRPIPERLPSGITNTSGKDEIILHKVSDEDKVNVLMFDSGVLKWFGTIENGTYTAKVTPETITGFPTVTDFDSLSFTILNSLIYFMSSSQEFYYRLQFNEVDEAYEVKDMYAWKDLIPFYPKSTASTRVLEASADYMLLCQCGIILTRFTLVLKTGEEVLHSPIYANYMYSFNRDSASITKDTLLANIHTQITTELDFLNQSVFDDEISAINFYATPPFYITTLTEDMNPVGANPATDFKTLIDNDTIKGEVQRMAEEPFYLVRTLDRNSVDETENNIVFYVGSFDTDIDFNGRDVAKINVNTIAAGSAMPVDNFSYHKLYGKITSNNGRLIVDSPKTVLSIGHIRALSLIDVNSKVGFYIDTEDGTRQGVAYQIDKALNLSVDQIRTRGLLSYPDSRANFVGGNSVTTDPIKLYKSRANKAHNLSCAFNFSYVIISGAGFVSNPPYIEFSGGISAEFVYLDGDIVTPANPPLIDEVFYTSENRIQFSESGEFSVWPAINSYRVGEGKIEFVGSNSVDPGNTDYIAPLLVGSSDGVYTINFDVTGTNLIQSITKAANLPALSSNNVLIDQNLIYVSDKGLIAINNGKILNLTRDFFPEQGNGNFPLGETVYPNYNILTNDFFGGPNPYILTDIVDYMKGAIFAYDGRRNNIWCSNPNKNFSLVFNLTTKQWDFSTYVFSKVIDFLGIINTAQEGEIYSRFLTYNESGDVDILSGENPDVEVDIHLLTRPIKMQSSDTYKKIERLISRSELYRSSANGYFSFGVWGKQDLNRDKINIPLVAIKDDQAFNNNVRQDIPIGRQKGKYKTITILQSGKLLPNSSLDNFEIVALAVDNNILR